MRTIGKSTKKVTKEAMARKVYQNFTDEQKADYWTLLGKIACGEVKNFHSTKVFKELTKDLGKDQKSVITYVCKKVDKLKPFENMDDLVLTEGK